MNEAFICDALRTPIGRYGGALSTIRTDDLAAISLKAILERNQGIDAAEIDDVIMGCANQAGEDNRNVARMALLLAGFPYSVAGLTVNRLCGSGMEAIGLAARAIKSGESNLVIAGGVENMTRAPFVMAKAEELFARKAELYDTTMGWRFINKKLEKLFGVDTMIETAENLAEEYKISRDDQDLFAYLSQMKAKQAMEKGWLAEEIIPVSIPVFKSEPIIFSSDEHPRLTALEKLAALKVISRTGGSVTAGNSSGINDGSAALIIASEAAIKAHNLKPLARITGMQSAGVPPRIMGIGPVPATNKLLALTGLTLDKFDIIELNEAFAAQSLACIRLLGLADDDPRINTQGGAIALGHPLGMSGARLVTTAVYQLQRNKLNRALCTMCIGVGQGIAIAIERV